MLLLMRGATSLHYECARFLPLYIFSILHWFHDSCLVRPPSYHSRGFHAEILLFQACARGGAWREALGLLQDLETKVSHAHGSNQTPRAPRLALTTHEWECSYEYTQT